MEDALKHECKTAYAHHQKSGQGNAVSVACANGCNGLWQIAQYHADGGHIATDVKNDALFHSSNKNWYYVAKIRKKAMNQMICPTFLRNF